MKCPGQDSGYWTGDAAREVPCPECGTAVEIFRDESTGRCRQCGHRFLNPGADFGCAKWCARGQGTPGVRPERQSTSDSSGALAARLIQWVEQELKNDPVAIGRALKFSSVPKTSSRQEVIRALC